MTDIKTLKDRIIFDGHSDTREECETITLMCDNLAKSKDFKTVTYESGYAEFEKVGNSNELKFAPSLFDWVVNFDSHITKVTITEGTEWTTSGESQSVAVSANTAFTVTLADGYVIDTATVSPTSDNYHIAGIEDNSFTLIGAGSASDITITITSVKLENEINIYSILPSGIASSIDFYKSDGTLDKSGVEEGGSYIYYPSEGLPYFKINFINTSQKYYVTLTYDTDEGFEANSLEYVGDGIVKVIKTGDKNALCKLSILFGPSLKSGYFTWDDKKRLVHADALYTSDGVKQVLAPKWYDHSLVINGTLGEFHVKTTDSEPITFENHVSKFAEFLKSNSPMCYVNFDISYNSKLGAVVYYPSAYMRVSPYPVNSFIYYHTELDGGTKNEQVTSIVDTVNEISAN